MALTCQYHVSPRLGLSFHLFIISISKDNSNILLLLYDMLVGNMWAQTWVNIEDLVLPYASSKPVNATPEIQKVYQSVYICVKGGSYKHCLKLLPHSRNSYEIVSMTSYLRQTIATIAIVNECVPGRRVEHFRIVALSRCNMTG